MKIDEAYLVGKHTYFNKSGVPARIIGVGMITPENSTKPRPCYHVQWYDKTEDWIPVDDNSNYQIISFEDILKGDIPKID